MKIDPNTVYVPSKNVVYREIEGEPIIVPITSGIGDLEDDLFSLNETGKAIWAAMDGKKTPADIAESLAAEYEGPADELKTDVTAFLKELLKRNIIWTSDTDATEA